VRQSCAWKEAFWPAACHTAPRHPQPARKSKTENTETLTHDSWSRKGKNPFRTGSSYLHDAGDEQVVITKHGKPAGVLIGFKSEEDWFEYRLMNDPRFLRRIEKARSNIRSGQGIPWETIEAEEDANKPME